MPSLRLVPVEKCQVLPDQPVALLDAFDRGQRIRRRVDRIIDQTLQARGRHMHARIRRGVVNEHVTLPVDDQGHDVWVAAQALDALVVGPGPEHGHLGIEVLRRPVLRTYLRRAPMSRRLLRPNLRP